MSYAGNIWDDHPALDGPFDWWACEEPERPPDDRCAFWHECRACRLAFAMAARANKGARADMRVSIAGLDPGLRSMVDAARAVAVEYGDARMLAVLDGVAVG